MFNPEERARLRSELLQYAAADKRISGAAITGSAASEREDRWSDVDLAFVSATEFRALTPTFRLIFGSAQEARHVSPPVATDLIGLGWLYALHARSCLARLKLWQAEYMISGMRDHALALACLRHGLPAAQGRGMDQLPNELTEPFEASLVRQLEPAELSRAFRVVMDGLLSEIRSVDGELAERLCAALMILTESEMDQI